MQSAFSLLSKELCFNLLFPGTFYTFAYTPARIMNTNILSNIAQDIRNEGLISNLEYNAKLLTQIDEVNNGGPVKPIFARNVAENARAMVSAKEYNEAYLNNERGCY